MITSDLLIGALLGGVTVAVIAALTGALIRQTVARRAATRAMDAAQQAALTAETRAETASKKAEAAQRQADANGQWYEAVVGEFERLLDRLRVVADMEAGLPGVENPGLRHAFLAETPVAAYCEQAEKLVVDRVAAMREEIAAASRTAIRNMSDTAQAALTRLQIKIDEELSIHTNIGPYHQGLIEIDHHGTQALHSLQRLRILAGSWPGVQREDCTFREIVESARGRIGPYLRVDHAYDPEVGEIFIEGRVVEPIILALAELLDNATAYSDDRVDVYVQEVHAGYRVVIEDRGLGMNVYQRAEAEYLLSRHDLMEAAALKDQQRLGFPVCGRLAHDYGFRVDVSAPSSSNGVKAVCLIPAGLKATPRRARPQSATAPASIAEAAAPPSALFPTAQPATDPALGQPVHGRPDHGQPAYGQPVHDQPVHDQPVHDQPVHDQPVHDQPVHDQPVHDQPAAGQPASEQPASGPPSFGWPATDQPSFDQSSFGPPAADRPALGQPAAEPVGDQAGADQPVLEQSAADWHAATRVAPEVPPSVEPYAGEHEPYETPIFTAAGLPKRRAQASASARPAQPAHRPITENEAEDGMSSLFEALRAGYAEHGADADHDTGTGTGTGTSAEGSPGSDQDASHLPDRDTDLGRSQP